MLLKDDHEEKRRKSIKRERRKVREKGGKEAQMQMENIKMYEKTEKSEKTGKQKKFEREELLRIKHLSVTFTQYDGWFSRKTLPVIRDLSLSVSRGERVAVVGSSGSGPIDESGRTGSRRERTDQFGKKPEGTGTVWP